MNIYIFFFYGASARFRAMASPTFFHHSSSSLVAAFQFRVLSRFAASLCMTPSHLLRGLATGLPPPKQLPSIFFGIRYSSVLTMWPAHNNDFQRTYVEKVISLYILYISSLYLILHTPLGWVRPNIFRRIFCSKESILFAVPWERIHTSLSYINILTISVSYGVIRTLQLMPRI
jgi:hypothetical protein